MARWWHFPQRFMLVVWLTLVTMIQILIMGELFGTESGEFVEAMSLAYELIGLLILFMILSAAGSSAYKFLESCSSKRVLEYVNMIFGFGAGVLMAAVTYQTRLGTSMQTPEYITLLTAFGVGVTGYFILGSIPERLYIAQYHKAVESVKGVVS